MIIKSLYNTLNHTISNNNENFKQINSSIISFDASIKNLTESVKSELITNSINLQYEELYSLIILYISNLEYQQNILTNIIDFTLLGKLHYFLVSPEQMTNIIDSISKNIPKHVTLPISLSKSNLISLYKIIKLSAIVINNEIIFEINIPLVNIQTFKIYKLTTIPVKQKNDVYLHTMLRKNLIIIDNKQEYYIALVHTNFSTNALTYRKNNTYVTQNQFST